MRTASQISLVLPFILFIFIIKACIADANSEELIGTTDPAITEDSAQNRTSRRVPFLSLRNITGSERASEFFGDRRDTLRAGYCELSRSPINSLKFIKQKADFYIPDEVVKLDAVRLLPVENFWSNMKNTLAGQSPVLYVHGFFISFNRGCRRASLLQDSLGLEGRLVLFSWPTDGVIFNYTLDESDLYWSVDPLQGVLFDMADRFGEGKINVVAHSLGARGVMLALVRLAQTQRADKPLLNQVILVAPDIDTGIFEQYLPVIRPLAHNITVYVSGNDSPLALSKQVHGYPRLGEAGEHLKGLRGIEIIDISDIPVRVPSGHLYHLYHNIVIEDLDQLINKGMPASRRRNLERDGEYLWRLQQPGAENQTGNDH